MKVPAAIRLVMAFLVEPDLGPDLGRVRSLEGGCLFGNATAATGGFWNMGCS